MNNSYIPQHFLAYNPYHSYNSKLTLSYTRMKKGANIDAKDFGNNTPLHLACKEGHSNVVQFLLAKGAEINAKNKYGDTPLHLACEEGNIEVIKELLKNSTIFDSLTIKNNGNKIPVELIPEANKEAIVSLIAKAKNMHSKDENLALGKPEEINDLSVNQQMSKDNSEQVSNNELQNDLKLMELPLVGHTEDTFSEGYGI